MATYLAYQIIMQKMQYNTIVAKFPAQKEGIDKVLDDMGWKIDSDGKCVAKVSV